jgi:hypothetical protein
VEVAQYLADEYFQLGDAVLICDRTTGKAIARISDADMYQPPDQVRESGNLAKPLPRLNPNLEGFLVSYIFEQERDRQLRADILATLPGTEFLAEHGDPKPCASPCRTCSRPFRAQHGPSSTTSNSRAPRLGA